MSIDLDTLNKAAKWVKQEDAQCVARTGTPLTGLSEITLFYPIEDPKLREMGAAYLERYCSTTNEAPTPSYTVTDPEAGREKFDGLWRNAGVRMSAGSEQELAGVYLTLRKGFATTLAAGEARLQSASASAAVAGVSYTRYWHSIDPRSVKTLITTAAAEKTVTNPSAQGQTLAGTFAVGQFTSQESPQGDGSHVISQALTKVTTVTSMIGTLTALTPRITRDNEILEPFGFKPGEGDAVAYVYGNLNPATCRDICLAYSDADLAAVPGAGWTYVNRRFADEENGTGTFTVLLRKVAWNAFDADAPDIRSYDNANTKNETCVETYLNITKATVYSGLTTVSTTLAALDYVCVSATISDKGDGSVNITRRSVKRTRGAAGDTIEPGEYELIGPHNIVTGTLNRFTIINENLSAATEAYMTPANATGYTLVATKEDKRGDGLWSKIGIYEKVTWTAWSDGLAAHITDHLEPEGDRPGLRQEWLGISKATAQAAETFLALHANASSGYWIESVNIQNQGNGSVNITRQQRKKIAGIAVAGSELINPHAFQHGTKVRTTTRYEDYTKSELPAGTAVGTSNVISNDEVGPKGNGLYDRVIAAETVTWRDWSNGLATTPDVSDPLDPAGERPGKRETWYGISNATADAAATYLAANPTANYWTPGINISPRGEGACDITRELRKQISNVGAAGVEQKNQHGLFPGLVTTTRIMYEDFTSAAIDVLAGPTVTLGGNYLSNRKIGPKGNGLFDREIIQVVVAWSKRWTDKVLVSDSDAGGFNARQVHVAEGMSAANSLTDYGTLAADSTYVLTDKQRIEKANGEFGLQRGQARVWTRTDETLGEGPEYMKVVEYKASVNGERSVVKRIWHRRTYAAMVTLSAAGTGVAASSFNFTVGVTVRSYTHLVCDVQDHGDGAYTVVQAGVYDGAGTETWYPEQNWTETDRVFDKYRGVRQYRDITYTHHIKYFASQQSALSHIKTSTSGLIIPRGGISCTEVEKVLVRAEWMTVTWGTWANE